MAEIGFYHLLATPLERALPRLLERARARGYRIVVRAASAERIEHLNALLWTYDDASFLPHGSARDGNAAQQPIWLTDRRGEPERAPTMLVLVDGVEADGPAVFARCADMFDGNDDAAVAAARERWRRAKAAGHTLTYWQQTDGGLGEEGRDAASAAAAGLPARPRRAAITRALSRLPRISERQSWPSNAPCRSSSPTRPAAT